MSPQANTDQKFQVRRQGRRLGPFNRTQIDRMIARQQLGPKDEISPAGQNQWQRVDQWQLDQQTPVAQRTTGGQGAGNEANRPDLDSHSQPGSDSLFAGEASAGEASAGEVSVGDWYVSVDGNRQGPMDEHMLGRWISERRINAETLVWRSGMQDWSPARDVLPAALLVSSPAAATAAPMSNFATSGAGNDPGNVLGNDPGDGGYALRDLRSRRAFWVLAVCIITYIFAAESFAIGIFQIYTAVATRRIESSGLVALWAVSCLIFAGLLLMTAIEITKLLSHTNRQGESADPVAVARHEHRMWLFGGLTAAFIIANQVILAIFFLITIAQAT